MSSYSNLVKSRFFRNIKTELKTARTAIQMGLSADPDIVSLSFNNKVCKQRYAYYMDWFDLMGYFELAAENLDVINYIEYEYIVLVLGKKKREVHDMISYLYYTYGNVPFYRGTSIIDNQRVYTAMLDIRFILPSAHIN